MSPAKPTIAVAIRNITLVILTWIAAIALVGPFPGFPRGGPRDKGRHDGSRRAHVGVAVAVEPSRR